MLRQKVKLMHADATKIMASATWRPVTMLSLAPAALTACSVGAYQGPRDAFVIVEPADGKITSPHHYTFGDGRFGSAGDGRVACRRGSVTVDGVSWPRILLRETRIHFRSGEVALAGVLIEPPEIRGNKPPLIVTVHGSENTGWIHRQRMPYMMAAQGVSVFAFDKRGTGGSGGIYNQNFNRLADDVAAASKMAKRMSHGRYSRFGLTGSSQGGWVAPRAANDAGAQFVAIGYGLLIDPLEEDAQQVATELRNAGYAAEALAQAKQITDATGAVMAAHFKDGYVRLAAVKARYGTNPWFKIIKGEFTGDLLTTPEAELRASGATKFDSLGIDWRYDAIGRLRQVTVPQLWVLAGADREAPPAETLARLSALRRGGKKIRIVRFPDTDHGIMEFIVNPDGSRTMTRVADGYFRLMADWIKGRWSPPYGRAEVLAH